LAALFPPARQSDFSEHLEEDGPTRFDMRAVWTGGHRRLEA